MPEYKLNDVAEELKELTSFFNERVSDIKQKYLISPDALNIIRNLDGTISFSLDIDKIK